MLILGDNSRKGISLENYFKNIDFSYHLKLSHPVLPASSILLPAKLEKLKKNTANVMNMNYKEICALINELGDIHFHCSPDGGTLLWNIQNPWTLTDSKSGRIFPNKDCPMKELKIIDPTGKAQSYFYYEDSKGEQFFFQAYCRTFIRNYFVARLTELAELYQQTTEPQYARKALEILARFAEVYPHWPYRSYIKNKNGWFRRIVIYSKDDKIIYDNWGGKWQSRWCNAEIQYNAALARAYDSVYNENILRELSKEIGFDIKKQIEDKLLLGMVRQVLKYPVSLFEGNAAGHIIENIAITGKVLGYPELVHLAHCMLENLINNNFLFDNMWKESTISYHDMTTKLINKAGKAMKGYSDPSDFKGMDGRNLKNVDFNINALEKAPEALSFPNGYITPINDGRISSSSSKMRPRNKPAARQFTDFLSATGHVSLGRGNGDSQMQYHLSFTDDCGHRHIDMLNTIMFAKKREMISDIGYSHSNLRPWSSSTLAHNTVLVDGQMQECKNGSLVYLLPNLGPVAATEAKARNVYSQCEIYKRFIALIDDSSENAFAFDIFRIKGGKVHDWVMHGSANEEMSLDISPTIPEMPGSWLGKDTKYLPGRNEYSSTGKLIKNNREIQTGMEVKDTPEGYVIKNKTPSCFHPFYGLVKSATRGKINGAVKASFTYTKEKNTGFNIYMLNKETSEISGGCCPSIRKEWRYLPDAPSSIPIFLCRQKSNINATNVFSAIIEPFSGKTFIKSVNDIKENGDKDAVAIEVVTTDKCHMILNTEGNDGKVKTLSTDLRGRFGVISLENGKPYMLFLSDGTLLEYKNWRIKAENNYNGDIASTNRSRENNIFSFDTNAYLPEGNLLEGNIIIVSFDNLKSYGYKIIRIEKFSNGSRIFLAQDPGFIIKDKNVKFLFYPKSSFKGLPKFVIPNKIMLNFTPEGIRISANTAFEMKTSDLIKVISLKELQTANGILELKN